MTTIRFIGDVHGSPRAYRRAVGDAERSIQVGDFGLGFVRMPQLGPGHRFIRGNHDCPDLCRERPDWIPDGMIEGECMFVGGATSIDAHLRVPGVSWWPDEQLSMVELHRMVELYRRHRPQVMVTHECPASVARELFLRHYKLAIEDRSNTREAFEVMLEIARPRLWVFGHWHEWRDQVIGGTRFICLPEPGDIGPPGFADLEVALP
mgnify:CR=1 FL=1